MPNDNAAMAGKLKRAFVHGGADAYSVDSAARQIVRHFIASP